MDRTTSAEAVGLTMTLPLQLTRVAGVLVTGALAGVIALGARRRGRLLQRLRESLALLRGGDARRLWRAVRVRVFSRRVAFGLRRDVRLPFVAPAAKLSVIVRPLRPDDDLSCTDAAPGLAQEVAWGRLNQRRLLDAKLPTCWIAAEPNGKVCYMQWLVGARENNRVQARWGGLFPVLAPNEALLEGAYTAETHRGQGIMAQAMAMIAAAARDLGADYVITFVDQTNVASLKGCAKAGFAPYIERRESWVLFRRRIRFLPLQNVTAAPSRSTRT